MTNATDFYEQLRASVKSLISDSGLKSNIVTIKRLTSAIQDPDDDYVVQLPTKNTYTLDAVVIGCEAEYVDGELVSADDLQVIVPPYAKLAGVEQSFEPLITDEIFIDNVAHVVSKVERVPASGTATVFLIFVKS